MQALTVFSWGYWGWGPYTRELVKAADYIERRNGMRPPIFVDIRYRRSVRAPGFRDDSFGLVVGRSRYKWLPKLGNVNITNKKARRAKIADPSGVDELLDLITDAHRDRRRVIFFCACQDPRICHRNKVASALLRKAKRRGIKLTVIEWPGGHPRTASLSVPMQVVRNMRRGGNRVPLLKVSQKRLREFVALPWASRVELRNKDSSLGIISGPAQPSGKGWYLPVIGPENGAENNSIHSLRKISDRLRVSLGYGERTATAS